MSSKNVTMDKCKYCDSTEGIITVSGDHKKLICAKCKRYIKFVGKGEYYPEIEKSNKNNKQKICPLLTMTSENIIEECRETECAWFVEYADGNEPECAMRSISWLADIGRLSPVHS